MFLRAVSWCFESKFWEFGLLVASEVEQELNTQGVAAEVIACWLSVVHWHAVSVAPQVVAELMASRMQDC